MAYHFGRLTGGFVNELLGGGAAAEDSFKYNMEAIKYQNEYNKPVNQMARLREAGLNPNLVYGGNSGSVAGNLSTAPTGNYQTRGGNLFDVLGGVLGAYQAFQNARKTSAEADILEHDYDNAKKTPFNVSDKSTSATVSRLLSNYLGIDGESIGKILNRLAPSGRPAGTSRRPMTDVERNRMSNTAVYDKTLPHIGPNRSAWLRGNKKN